MSQEENGLVLSEEQRRRRRHRNIAIGIALFVLVVLFYMLTVFRLGSNVFNRPI